MHTIARMNLVTLESAYLNYAKNSSCRLLCINALLIHSEYNEYEPGQKLENWFRNWFYWNQHPQIIQDSLAPRFYTKYSLCYLMLSKWAKGASTQWKLFFAWKLISFHFSSMFYAIYSVFQDLYQICLCVIFSIQKVQSINLDPKHFIQLSQQSKMSNSRSRIQYNTLKLVPLDSVPSNWGKR